MFRKLTINNWRQFSNVEIDFHEKLTILTGANGSGKTTILHLLNRHWGWNLPVVSTPKFNKQGIRKYWTGFWAWEKEEEKEIDEPAQRHQIGSIEYLDGQPARLEVPENVEETFNIQIQNTQPVNGVYVPAHRPPYVFQRVEQIPTKLDAKKEIFQTYLNELINRFNPNQRTQSTAYRIKTSLISLATFGYGNEAVDRNEDAVRTFEGFQNILRIVLPKSLGFKKIRVRVPDVLFETETGDFSFDAVSGGVAAIVDVSWQIYMYSLLHKEFVVVIDEPEAHLHPELQQKFLPNLLKAFPKAQFIIATHNPFIVTSVPDSNVYVLDYNDNRRVESTLLDMVNKAGSANEVLREVLGVPFTVPIWVHEEIQKLIMEYRDSPIEENLEALKRKLAEKNLENAFPTLMTQLLLDSLKDD